MLHTEGVKSKILRKLLIRIETKLVVEMQHRFPIPFDIIPEGMVFFMFFKYIYIYNQVHYEF